MPPLKLLLISALAGIVFLKIFGMTSDQRGIKQLKNRIQAGILEIALFRDHPRLIFIAQGRLFLQGLAYLWKALLPLLVIALPAAVLLAHLDTEFASRALKPGEKTLVSVKIKNTGDLDRLSLRTSEGLEFAGPPFRDRSTGRIERTVRALQNGRHELIASLDGRPVKKNVCVNACSKLPRGSYRSLWLYLLAGGESRIPAQTGIESVEVQYPELDHPFLGFKVHWIVVFLTVSIVTALALKGVLRVEI